MPLRRFLLLGALALTGCALDDKDGEDGKHDLDASIPDGAIILDAPDIPPDVNPFCATCGPGTICVQFFDGVCGSFRLECQPRNEACLGNACSAECMRWQCNAGDETPFFRCDVAGCPGQVPGALYCYGP